MSKEEVFQKKAFRISRESIVVNLFLSVCKLFAGLIANSDAMISDAVHSASDVFSTFIVMIGIKISGKEADKEHPYGHERLECVASVLLAITLAVVGIGIGYKAVLSMINGTYGDAPVPGILALLASIVSIAVKELMFRRTRRVAKEINSSALMADAWHHRSDALSSVGALIGIAGARLGARIMDPLASVIICVFILKAAWDIFADAVNKMVDHSCDEETEAAMREVILNTRGVEHIDELKTRVFGARCYVEAEIAAEPSLTLNDAHEIAEAVHDAIEDKFPNVKHCTIHVNPAD